MASRYKGVVPQQTFHVMRYTTARSAWQRRLRHWRARGVWVYTGTVIAHTGQEACSVARRSWPHLRRADTRLRAFPTWEKAVER